MSFRSNHRATGLAAVLEADNELVAAGDEVQVAENETALVTAEADLGAEADDISADAALAETAAVAGEGLDNLAEITESAIESGEGLAPETAEAVTVAVETICNMLNIKAPVVASMEAFSNATSRRTESKLVLLGIGETLKTMWTSLKNIAARIKDKIVSFITGLIGSSNMLTKHLVAMKDRLRKLDGAAAPKDKELSSGLAAKLSVKGKADFGTAMTLADNATKLVEVSAEIPSMYKAVSDSATALISKMGDEGAIAAYVKSAGHASEVSSKALLAIRSDLQKNTQARSEKVKKAGNKTKLDSLIGPFAGNTALRIVIEGPVTAKGVQTDALTLNFERADDKPAEKLAALDQGKIGEVLAKAIDMADRVTDLKKTQDNTKASLEKITQLIDTVIGSALKSIEAASDGAETRRVLSELRRDVADQINTLNQIATRAPAVFFSTARLLGDYASISLANLGTASK